MPYRVVFPLVFGVTFLTSVVNPHILAQQAHSVGAVGLPSHSSVTFAPARPSAPLRPAPAPALHNHHQYPHQPAQGSRQSGGSPPGGIGYQDRSPRPFLNHYVAYPWLFPFGYGPPFGDDSAFDNSSQEAPADLSNGGPSAVPPEVADNQESAYRPPYQPQSAGSAARPQPATTLVFNDGRPAMEVHNYALTNKTLYALDDEKRQEIPLSELDLPATIDANRKAGVDFALQSSH